MLLQRYGWARRHLPRRRLFQRVYGGALCRVPRRRAAYNGTVGLGTVEDKAGRRAAYNGTAGRPAPARTRLGAVPRKAVWPGAAPRTTRQNGKDTARRRAVYNGTAMRGANNNNTARRRVTHNNTARGGAGKDTAG